jgi:hypothetical protein
LFDLLFFYCFSLFLTLPLGLLLCSANPAAPSPAPDDPAALWAQLRHHVCALQASGAHGHRLAIAAADAILSARRAMTLPQWLVAVFKGGAAQVGGGRGQTAVTFTFHCIAGKMNNFLQYQLNH